MRAKLSDALRFMTRTEIVRYVLLIVFRILSTVLDLFSIVMAGVTASLLVATSGLALPGWISEIVYSLPQDRVVLFAFSVFMLLLLARSLVSSLSLLAMANFLAGVEARAAARIVGENFLSSSQDNASESLGSLFWAGLGSTTAAVSRRLTHFSTIAAESFGVLSIIALLVFVGDVAVLFFAMILGAGAAILFGGLSTAVGRHNARLARAAESASNFLDQIVDNRRELVVYGRQKHYLVGFQRIRRVLARGEGVNAFYGSIPRVFVELIGFVALGAFLLVLLPETSSEPQDLQAFASLFFGILRISASMLPLQRALIELHGDQYLAEASNAAYSDNPVSPQPAASTQTVNLDGLVHLPAPNVTVNSVSFFYPGQDSRGLRANFSIPQGVLCAVIGPSGSGKTTLLNLIAGFSSPSKGTVEIGGLSPDEFRGQRPGAMAYVPQNPGHILGSVEDNIVMGEPVDTNRLLAALDFSGLNALGHRNGFVGDAEVGGIVKKLSGGQLQRVGLARAIYREPGLLILDESTSSLDAKAESEIFARIKSLGQGTTRIVTSHRADPLRKADYVVVVASGAAMAYGSLAEAVSENAYARAFFDG